MGTANATTTEKQNHLLPQKHFSNFNASVNTNVSSGVKPAARLRSRGGRITTSHAP